MASYVMITREEFEAWLDTLGQRWSRAPGTEGVYLVHLSPDVAVHISSSVGSSDKAMGRAQGAMYMRLVSTTNGRTLNKKDVGQGKFYRTSGWQNTLRKAFDRLKLTYTKAKAFYDKLAEIDPNKYKKETIKLIEEVPGWETDALLKTFHTQVEEGKVLSDAQEKLITNAKGKAQSQAFPADDTLLERLRSLWSVAKRRNDTWTMEFVESLANQVKSRRNLSPKQEDVLDKKFQQYRVGNWDLCLE